jgi:hypothetical protein
VTFVAKTSAKPAGAASQAGCGSVMKRGLTVRIPIPALLTSKSMPPQSSQICSMPAWMDASSRTSIPSPTTSSPSATAVACARERSRLVAATRAPETASACAIAFPSPLVAPVTTTRVPLNRIDTEHRRAQPRSGWTIGGWVLDRGSWVGRHTPPRARARW